MNLNVSILLAFQKFKKVFIINVLYPLIYTVYNIFIFFSNLDNPLFLIAYGYLFGSIISCILSLILIIPYFYKNRSKISSQNNYRQDFMKVHKDYGISMILQDIFIQLTGLLVNLIFFSYGFITYITYYGILQIIVISGLNPSNNKSILLILLKKH